MVSLDIVRIGVRGLHLAALLAAVGTLGFVWLVAPVGLHSRLIRMGRGFAAAALALGGIWFSLQAAVIAGTADWAEWAQALPVVGLETRFGHVLIARTCLLVLVVGLSGRTRFGQVYAFIAASLALASQGLVGHAGAADQAWGLATAEALHLLAAALWLGSLPPLLLCLLVLPAHGSREACERFSPLGLAAVLIIAATALAQAWPSIGSLPGMLGTDYGHVALMKLGLFILMLVCAAWNRLVLTDRLDTVGADRARYWMTVSVAVETGLGLLVVLAAGGLGSLPPAVHSVIVWPLHWTISAGALEDDDLRRVVALAIIALGVAVMMVACGALVLRSRVVTWPLALALAGWQGPTLSLFLVAAYPTSFQLSPTGFTASAIVRGDALFATHCTTCHGAQGYGDGPGAIGMRIRPADLTAGHLWDHSDGELFWWIGHGIRGPDDSLVMPGFEHQLDPMARWSLIDAIRARNAGAAMHTGGNWTNPLPAPDIPLVCRTSTADMLSQLQGRFVRVVSGSDSVSSADVVTVRLDRATGDAVPASGCQSASADAWLAYARIAGLEPERLGGTEFLVDDHGWLRALRRTGQTPDWDDGTTLSDTVRRLRTQPITGSFGGLHVHKQ